jgi:hypothetical protein
VVGVVVRLERADDPDVVRAREVEIRLDVQRGIDHGRHAGMLIADEVGSAPEVVGNELPKDHVPTVTTRPACFLEVTEPQ